MRSYYKDLGDGVSMAYMYFSESTASNSTYANIDIVIFAHAHADSDGTISNLATISSYLPSRVTKCHNNGTYALLSFDTTNMSTIAASSALRSAFASSIVSAINTLNLDGVDIDWEFPATAEKANFTLLMAEIYSQVKANNPHHLVTAATGIDTYTRYDLENAINYLDYVNIMTYDMQNSSYAQHHSALSYKSGSTYRAISNAYTFYVTNLGLNPSKLILGIPFYGRKFSNTDGLGSSATHDGAVTYSAIVSTYLTDPNYTYYWDANCQAPYLYSSTDRIFITYDNPYSIALKCEYAAEKGFAGVMYWQDAQDSGDELFNAIIQGMSDNKILFSKNTSGLLGILKQANKNEVFFVEDLSYGGSVYNDVTGSVSLYTPIEISINTSEMLDDAELVSRGTTYGTFDDVEFVVIHDTGNSASGSSAKANVQYMTRAESEESWHYGVGDTTIYQGISEDYTGWHAGCGQRVFVLENTGVNANKYGNMKPVITINASGYYCINGEATTLRPYTNIAGTTKDTTNYSTSQITPTGIYYEIGSNGNYYLNKTYYNSTYGKICNFGGNTNGIAIETTVNNGSDMYQTWHNAAKLTADILVRNDLKATDVLFHNSFSGKDCPHAMLDVSATSEFLKMVEIEYMIRKYYSDYTITFESLSPTLIDNNGKVIGSVTSDTEVYYRVTITKNATSQSIVLSSTILG